MTLLGNTSVSRLALACLLVAGVSACQAQSGASLDKHGRKIHHKMSKYPSGRYLHLVLRDDSNNYGVLGTLSETSFTFTNADNNSTATYSYNDIDKVNTGREQIGEGTEPRYRVRHLVPIVVTVAAVGAAGAIYAAER